ncbi:MAG TPA: hypothetical protein VLR52_04820, partial [Bacteroidales bacterium]|nr:hypothetical protein [Bacteroidales bacterium]
MKKSFHVLLAAGLASLCINAKSQDNLSKSLASIKDRIQDVQIDKTTYKQSVEILDANKAKLSFSASIVDEKGKA